MIDKEVHDSLERTLQTWDRDAARRRAAEAEKLRERFVEQYAIESWPDLELDQYALGQHIEGTVCWWLEYETKPIAGIGGGTARKHLIYRKSNGAWYYPRQYGSVEQAWEAIRSGFVEMFDLARRGLFNETDRVEALATAAMVRAKLLYLYFPSELLPIGSKDHLDHFLRRLGQSMSGLSPIQANRHLLSMLRSVPELADIGTQELGYFVYHSGRSLAACGANRARRQRTRLG